MSTSALTAVLAKLAGLGTAAKATVGVAVAVGAVGAAAGVPVVVHEIASVGDSQVVVSTSDEPTADVTAEPTSEPTDGSSAEPTSEPTSDPTSVPTSDPTASSWQDAATFGAWVSAQARAGEVDGQQIAAAAHERNQLRAQTRTAVQDPTDTSGDQTQAGTDEQDATSGTGSADTGSGTRADGASHGHGH